ncbi:sigma-70 family RNA polymerase sigma factor [Nonomuraea sp. NPDC050536]|uniref:sigma-70 family RNA polymerase sigma factor n=1 Tax=Nonomuraea sp. NPDC050536 TaxID=3364366 RepID=UPI0037CC41E7
MSDSELVRAEPREPESERDLLRQYLDEIGETPLLTAEQEVELAKRIEAGLYARRLLDENGGLPASRQADLLAMADDGETAKDHMIRANLRLVVAIARRFPQRGMSLLDMIQEGNLGLIKAVEKFDYAKGFKFSTYATWWIRQAIQRGLADRGRTVRLPIHVVEDLGRHARIERELTVRLGREPTVEETAAETGWPVAKVLKLRTLARREVSLDMPVGEDRDRMLADLIEDPAGLSAEDVAVTRRLAEHLRSLVDTLSPDEALVITLRFGLHNGHQHTFPEIARRTGLSLQRVRRLEKQALTRLRRREPMEPWAG